MSLSSVANRIQERNNALLSEIAQLDLLQAQHEEATHQLTQEQHSSTNARKQLLSAVRSRHGLELECLRLKEESTSIDTTVSKLQSSINDIRNQTTQLQTKFGTTHEPIYAQHDVSTKLYSMQSKSILLRAQKKIQHREDKLRHLAEETKRQAAEAEEMRAERERIRLEIGEMERREEDEDDEMGGLTMQIKQILAKVSEIHAMGGLLCKGISSWYRSFILLCSSLFTSSENISPVHIEECQGDVRDCC